MPKPDYTSLEFPPAPDWRPLVIVNMVSSIDGKVVVEGTEKGIGSKADQRLMRELRLHADVILNGATTLRLSGATPRLGDPLLEEVRVSRGKPRLPASAVISRSGNLPLERAFFTAGGEFDAFVYLSEAATEEARARVVAAGRPVIAVPAGGEVKAMLGHLRRELGAGLVLCEGGPDINAELLRLDAIDEFFLTIGPVAVAGPRGLTAVTGDTPYTRETLKRWSLVSAVTNESTDEVYLRYRARR